MENVAGLISVIMLTYNREHLVSRMIECILTQTYKNFEFIIVDNGSTDRSGEIADIYAKKDSRIFVIHKERGNIGSGRNAGLDTAHGESIAFVDDDDYCAPDFLAFLYSLLTGEDIDISICGASDKVVGESRIMSTQEALETLYWRKLYNNQFPTKLIRSKLFNGIRFSDSAKYDDIELMTYIIAAARQVAYNGKPQYTFYRHDKNNSAWTTCHELLTAETLQEYLDVYRKRTLFLLERFPENGAKWKYFEWSFMISMVNKVIENNLTDCFKCFEAMRQELQAHRDEFVNSEWLQHFEREWMRKYI